MKNMKRRYSNLTAWTLAAVIIVMSGCGGQNTRESTGSQTTPAAEAKEEPAREEPSGEPEQGLEAGSVISGFTVESVSDSEMLQAQVIGFTHEQSGAKLVWVKNRDQELAFSVSFHTPYIDEIDTNHVFEHAIVASSEKYPSKDLFFDIAGKSYNTFVNAFTYNTFTSYPVSSESEEQLMKLMDAYLSCMAAPHVLENENFFKREAVRYELDSPEDEIRMVGTVYAEDFGFLTDMAMEANNNLEDALYPGQYASNAIGRAHRNYQNLTYEAVLDTYERYYHFDNSLLFLYGDLDYERVLSFIDSEYLSKAERQGTDLSAYRDPASRDGYEERTVFVPAFEGDRTEDAAQIDYAFGLEDKSWEDLLAWDVLAGVLNHENSSFHTNLKARGIQNQVWVYVNLYNAKPYLQFSLQNGEPEQSWAFKTAVDETLAQIAEEGADREILRSLLKQTETSNYLLMDQVNVGVNVFPNIVNYWTHTGQYDYYQVFEQTLKAVEKDSGQEIFRRLAEEAGQTGPRALVVNVPKPGLAEDVIRERDAYLEDMKASMTDEEIGKMIQDTKAFREWNESECSNSDFVIDPAHIPDEKPYTGYEKEERDGLTFYMAPAQAEKVGKYMLYLDAGDLADEEQMDLGLLCMLAGNMGTGQHTLEEILNLKSEYLHSYTMERQYPDGENAYPMMRLEWTALTEDYETGFSLLLEMLCDTDFSDTERILQLLVREADRYDVSRADDKLSAALDLAKSYIDRGSAYQEAYDGQEFYNYLEDTREQLEQDGSYGAVLAQRLRSVSHKLMRRGRLIFACAAPESDLEEIRTVSAGLLESLPSKEMEEGFEPSVTLPEKVQKRAVIVESSDQYSVSVGDCYGEDGFAGKYVPFLMAAADRYTDPRLRFQMGASSSGITFSADSGGMVMYSYSDPNGAKTMEVFEGTADAIRQMELTQEDLDGYILTAVSMAGMARGVLNKPLRAMDNEILGLDTEKACRVVNDMKRAAAGDREAAAECFEKIIEQSGMVTVGSEARLRADGDAYDRVLSYKTGD